MGFDDPGRDEVEVIEVPLPLEAGIVMLLTDQKYEIFRDVEMMLLSVS